MFTSELITGTTYFEKGQVGEIGGGPAKETIS